MALTSSSVATGQVILADHLNKIRADLVTNHDHSSGQGGTVDHMNLAESDTGNMSGFNHRHQDLEYHLLGGGPGGNSIDNPGGSQGVHGLAASAFVVGSIKSTNGLVIHAGNEPVTAQTGTVTFADTGVAFTAIVAVILQSIVASPDQTWDRDVDVTSKSATGFSWECDDETNWPDSFDWIAVGTKS
jgi:hypothetical protein